MTALLSSVPPPRCLGWYTNTCTPCSLSSVTSTHSSDTGTTFSIRVMKYITPM